MDVYLCHYRLNHMNKNRINRLIKEKIFEINNCESLPTYESSLLRKMTKSSFTGKNERASNVLSLVHTNVCGSMNSNAREGYSNFITFTDYLSSYKYIYLIKNKSESFKMFK